MRSRLLPASLAAWAMMLPLSSASAQAPEGDFQAWTALFVTGPVTDESKLLFWFDGHSRFRDDASDLGVTILRPGVGWRLGGGVDAWVGYARVVSRSESAPAVEEDRFWQQATYPITGALGGALSGRTRLEQRFRNTGDTGWRFRQFVRWERRFADSPVSPVAWNELFLNIDDADWGQSAGFDQNRLFVGAAWRPNARLRLETGYLNVRLRSPAGVGRTDNAVTATLFFGL